MNWQLIGVGIKCDEIFCCGFRPRRTILDAFPMSFWLFLMFSMTFLLVLLILYFPARGTCAGGKCKISKIDENVIEHIKNDENDITNASKIARRTKIRDIAYNFCRPSFFSPHKNHSETKNERGKQNVRCCCFFEAPAFEKLQSFPPETQLNITEK